MIGEQGGCSGVLISNSKYVQQISLVFDLNMYLSAMFIKNIHKDTQTYSRPYRISTKELFFVMTVKHFRKKTSS